MKKNILLPIALTFVSSVVWSGVANVYTSPSVHGELKPKEFIAHVSVSHLNAEDNLYVLSIPDVDGEKIEITIRDEDNNILYNRTKVIVNDFCQAYRIEGQSGDIVFEVWNKEDKQVKTFRFSPNDEGSSRNKDQSPYQG